LPRETSFATRGEERLKGPKQVGNLAQGGGGRSGANPREPDWMFRGSRQSSVGEGEEIQKLFQKSNGREEGRGKRRGKSPDLRKKSRSSSTNLKGGRGRALSRRPREREVPKSTKGKGGPPRAVLSEGRTNFSEGLFRERKL